MTIPAEQWEEGEKLLVEFFTSEGDLIDAYRPVLGVEKVDYPAVIDGEKLIVTDNGDKLMIRGEGFEIPFDKATGLIVNAKAGEQVIIEKGPFLNLYVNLNHLTGAEVLKWPIILRFQIRTGKKHHSVTLRKKTEQSK